MKFFCTGETSLRTCIVLGAGASYGDEWLFGKSYSRPPLDAGFFDYLSYWGQRVSPLTFETVLALAKREFGTFRGAGLEELFNRLTAKYQFGKDLPRSLLRSDTITSLKDIETQASQELEALKSTIYSVYSYFSKGQPPFVQFSSGNSSYHIPLVERLDWHDAILTFNYDCIVEECIAERRPEFFGQASPYGIRHKGQLRYRTGRQNKGTMPILKLHGSVYFESRPDVDNVLFLRDENDSRIDPLIVPPTFEKDVFQGVMGRIWRRAANAIDRAEAAIVIGYSSPSADFKASALLGTSLGKSTKPLKLFAVVNPSETDRIRVAKLFGSRINGDTLVFQFADWWDLIMMLEERPLKKESWID